MLSCTRFLCNRARELLERDALEALDVCVLVEIAHNVHRRALFKYELKQLALLIPRFSLSLSLSADSLFLSAVSHSAGFLCVSLSTTSLAERLVSSSVSASTYSLASASPCSSFGFIYFTYNGGLWTTCNFSKSYFSRTTRTRLAAPFVHSRLNHRQLVHRAKQVLDFLIAIV